MRYLLSDDRGTIVGPRSPGSKCLIKWKNLPRRGGALYTPNSGGRGSWVVSRGGRFGANGDRSRDG